MFKFILSCIILSVAADQAYDIVTISPKQLQYVVDTSQSCITELNAHPESLKQFLEGTYENNKGTKEFIYCFLTKGKFGDAEGYLLKENIAEVAAGHKSRDNFIQMMDECNQETMNDKDKYDRVYHVSQCFHEKTPIKFKTN